MKSFRSTKDMMDNVNRKVTEWKKTWARSIPDERLIPSYTRTSNKSTRKDREPAVHRHGNPNDQQTEGMRTKLTTKRRNVREGSGKTPRYTRQRGRISTWTNTRRRRGHG